MSVDYREIGRRIKVRRKQSGKTQETMAEYLDVSVGYVSQIERGVTKINLDTLSRISTVLGCDISELVSGTSKEATEYLSRELSEKYAKLSQEQKRLVVDFIDLLIKHAQ